MSFSTQTRQNARSQQDFAELHNRVGQLTKNLESMALPGETIAQTCLRLGTQHPIVRQRDFTISAYRRVASALRLR